MTASHKRDRPLTIHLRESDSGRSFVMFGFVQFGGTSGCCSSLRSIKWCPTAIHLPISCLGYLDTRPRTVFPLRKPAGLHVPFLREPRLWCGPFGAFPMSDKFKARPVRQTNMPHVAQNPDSTNKANSQLLFCACYVLGRSRGCKISGAKPDLCRVTSPS